MDYIVEFYPEEGVHPNIKTDDLLFRSKTATPFPIPNVGEPLSLLSVSFDARTTIGKDKWVVKRRHFLYWEGGCTVMFWCVPQFP